LDAGTPSASDAAPLAEAAPAGDDEEMIPDPPPLDEPETPAAPAADEPVAPERPAGPELPAPPAPEMPAPEPPETPTPEAPETPAPETPAPGEQPVAPPDPFAGGTMVRLEFSERISHEALSNLIAERLGPDRRIPVMLSNPDYVEGDRTPYKEWTARIALPPEEALPALESVAAELGAIPYFPSSNTIGGKVAREMRERAIVAILGSLVMIVLYIWVRFQRVIFGLAAVVALVHDVLFTLGVIGLSAFLAQIPGVQKYLLIGEFKIGLVVLAAFLTIIGYSLNDTIIIFDRIREVRGKAPRLTADMVNLSVNQTLSRTILTSGSTLLVVVTLYIGGGQAIHTFAFALMVGVLVGTYSSVFVAAPVVLWMSNPKR
jgi:SecD/SecF fusion protein